jgi:hypothetical protein
MANRQWVLDPSSIKEVVCVSNEVERDSEKKDNSNKL